MGGRTNVIKLVGMSILWTVLLSSAGAGRTITVDDDGPADFNNIQAAINDANNGDTVIVADGIYSGKGNRDINAGPEGVENVVVRSTHGPENCIIDGSGGYFGFHFDALNYANHKIPVVLLDGFKITNCQLAIALHQTGQYPAIRNCILTGNGGGIRCGEWNCIEISNCTIVNNTGGIQCDLTAEPTIQNCIIANNAGTGIYCIGARPFVTNCIVSGNKSKFFGGGFYIGPDINYASEPQIHNCIVTGNKADSGGAFYITGGSNVQITNCTISGNNAGYGGAIYLDRPSYTTIKNSILWADTANKGQEIYRVVTSILYVKYSDLQGGWTGTGNINVDPCFASPGYWDANGTPADTNDDFWVDGDYHLKSQAGRWNPATQDWVIDDVTSLCIDAGDSSSDWTAELWPHGKRINMGAYGGTPQASMSLSGVGNIADLNNDDTINFQDFTHLAGSWYIEEILLSEDLNRDGTVDFNDLFIFADNWLNGVTP